MKTIYKINKVIVIINLILFIIPYFGLIFMMATGATQIILYLIHICYWKKIPTLFKKHLILYGLLVMATLSFLYFGEEFVYAKDFVFVVSLISAGLLAFYSLYISRALSLNDELKSTRHEL
ncbi:hypothetical protein [uncultured Dokdonia sp.]|uniref:hypothetical protein n=1 Tax=uncultured Dokdonia sp. TaxID=575653 RepID=UPI0030ED61BD|tara:strand:+ start:21014 stop:21376 length:363 start_codon:yes stop_codon:yes gene_type:complete